MRRWKLLGLALLLCSAAADDVAPTVQDMRVVGRVLAFQDSHPSGGVTVAIPYASSNPASRAEAEAIASLMAGGLTVGSLVLNPAVIPQERLESAPRFDAVLATASVDGALLRAALASRRVPCVTFSRLLVERGVCTVAIRSVPSVSIMLSSANAASIGIRFATAFRMMVTEL